MVFPKVGALWEIANLPKNYTPTPISQCFKKVLEDEVQKYDTWEDTKHTKRAAFANIYYQKCREYIQE